MSGASISRKTAGPLAPDGYLQKLVKTEGEFHQYQATALQLLNPDQPSFTKFIQILEQCKQIDSKMRARLAKLNTPEKKTEIACRLHTLDQIQKSIDAKFQELLTPEILEQEQRECVQEFKRYNATLPNFEYFNFPTLRPFRIFQEGLSRFNECMNIYSTLRERLNKRNAVDQMTKLDQVHSQTIKNFHATIGSRIQYSYMYFCRQEFEIIFEQWNTFLTTELPVRSTSKVRLLEKYQACQQLAESLISCLKTLPQVINQLKSLEPLFSEKYPDFYTAPIELSRFETRVRQLIEDIQLFSHVLYPQELLTKDPLTKIPHLPRTISEVRSWIPNQTTNTPFTRAIAEKFPFYQETSTDGDAFFSAFVTIYLGNPECREILSKLIAPYSTSDEKIFHISDLLERIEQNPKNLNSIINEENNLLVLINYFRSQLCKFMCKNIQKLNTDPEKPLNPNEVASLGLKATIQEMSLTAFIFNFFFELIDLDDEKSYTFAPSDRRSLPPGTPRVLAKKEGKFLILYPPTSPKGAASSS